MTEHHVRIPKRRDGTNKRWWYDATDGHVFHRRDDGSIHCFNLYCEHEVQPVWR